MIEEQSNTQKVIKGISSQTIVTLVLGVVEILSFSIMSRLLTKEDFGYYAAITAITSVFSAFSETGIGSAIIQQKTISKRYVDNAFTISLLFGAFISLLLFVLSGVLSSTIADASMKVPLMLMSGTLLLQCLTSINTSLMYRKLQFLRVGTINLVSLVITTCVAIFLAYKGYGYYAIITKAVLSAILTYFLSLLLCKTRFGFALDKKTFNTIFSFSGWLMASALFRNLAHQIDKLLMPRLLSVTALGAYNRPKEFVEQVSTKLNGIFDTALFPVLSGIQDDAQRLKRAFCRSLFYLNVFSMLLTLLFVCNSSLIIRVFLGKEWLDLNSIMIVVACTLLFNINGRLADCYLRSLAMTKQQFLFRVLEVVLKTIGILLGYKGGIMGVALSVLITNVIAKLIKLLYVGREVDVKISKCLRLIFSSWRFGLFIIPIWVIAFLIIPESLLGEIILALLFVISVIILFLFTPQLIGKQYEEEGYAKLKSLLARKMHLHFK